VRTDTCPPARVRSLKWIIAVGLVGLFWMIGNIVGAFVLLFQDLNVPLTLWIRFLIGYGPLAIRMFGMVAAAAWVLSDVYFRGRWVQWFLFGLFVFVIIGIILALVSAANFPI
jgi:hypothetical protein